MRAEIVMIGTELLLGEIVDTNAGKLAKMLRGIGLDLYYKSTVGDNEDRITGVINLALDRSGVVITSGGLGPTVDDVTRQAAANATGRRLVYSKDLEDQIAARFKGFGRRMTDNNKRQAYIPEGAVPLPNPVGTAPCFLSDDSAGRGFVICLPGVPRELEHMMMHTVLPLLTERMGGAMVVRIHKLRTCAVGESNVDLAIRDLMEGENPTIGLAAHPGQTDVRITAKAATESEADALIAPVAAAVRERLGVAVYGTGEQTLAEVVGQLLDAKSLRLAVADTVTEGALVGELVEAGYGHIVTADPRDGGSAIGGDQASGLAEAIAPDGGVGLALAGNSRDDTVSIAVHGPGTVRHTVPTRAHRREPEYIRRWRVIQGLDMVRRAVLGQLSSPVDWRVIEGPSSTNEA